MAVTAICTQGECEARHRKAALFGLFLPKVWIEDGTLRVFVPFWLLLTLAAVPTAVLWRRDRRTAKPGCCVNCGYDLRASKKTCPECGTAIANPEK